MKSIDNPYTHALIISYPEGDYSLEKTIRVFPDTALDKHHIVKEDDTLTSLANLYYGSGRYWYIIADKNDLSDIDIFSLVVGSMIVIPNKDLI